MDKKWVNNDDTQAHGIIDGPKLDTLPESPKEDSSDLTAAVIEKTYEA